MITFPMGKTRHQVADEYIRILTSGMVAQGTKFRTVFVEDSCPLRTHATCVKCQEKGFRVYDSPSDDGDYGCRRSSLSDDSEDDYPYGSENEYPCSISDDTAWSSDDGMYYSD